MRTESFLPGAGQVRQRAAEVTPYDSFLGETIGIRKGAGVFLQVVGSLPGDEKRAEVGKVLQFHKTPYWVDGSMTIRTESGRRARVSSDFEELKAERRRAQSRFRYHSGRKDALDPAVQRSLEDYQQATARLVDRLNEQSQPSLPRIHETPVIEATKVVPTVIETPEIAKVTLEPEVKKGRFRFWDKVKTAVNEKVNAWQNLEPKKRGFTKFASAAMGAIMLFQSERIADFSPQPQPVSAADAPIIKLVDNNLPNIEIKTPEDGKDPYFRLEGLQYEVDIKGLSPQKSAEVLKLGMDRADRVKALINFDAKKKGLNAKDFLSTNKSIPYSQILTQKEYDEALKLAMASSQDDFNKKEAEAYGN